MVRVCAISAEILIANGINSKRFLRPRLILNYTENSHLTGSSLLAVPRVSTCFGSRSFAVAAPTTWNSLPLHIRNSSSKFGFRRQLKTFLYNLGFSLQSLLAPHPKPQRLKFSDFPPTLRAL